MNINEDTRYRRYVGLCLGLSLGFVYGLVSQGINQVFLPNIPLYRPPLGLSSNILLWSLSGALLGLVTALPAETIGGAIYGGATGAFLITLFTLASGKTAPGAWTAKIISVLFLFIPLAGGITPFAAMLRWGINRFVEGKRIAATAWEKFSLPLLLIIMVGLLGILSRMPPYARNMVLQMDKMLQTGLRCSQESQLPEPLQQVRVGGFLSHATERYYLEWQNQNINRFEIPRPMSDRPWEESVVVARFDNGWNLVCLYAKSDVPPSCKGYEYNP